MMPRATEPEFRARTLWKLGTAPHLLFGARAELKLSGNLMRMSKWQNHMVAAATTAFASMTSKIAPAVEALGSGNQDRLRHVRRHDDWLVLLLTRNVKPD